MDFAAITTILLDRDGTLIEDCHYLCDPDAVCLIPGVAPAMAALRRRGVRFFLVSNQSGLARGLFTQEELTQVQVRLSSMLAAHGACLDDAVFCPHGPEDACRCRKPGPGLWEALRARHHLDPSTTLVVGDKASDVAFGLAQGCLTALVHTGHGKAEAAKLGLPPLHNDPMKLPSRPAWPHLQASSLTAVLHMLLALGAAQ